LIKPAKPKRVAGGAATAAGMNFQAAVTAIASIYMARGQPLGWMATTLRDVPVALEVETGSGGDDLRLYVDGGATVEVQVKKGLAKGNKLWTALLDLSAEVTKNGQTYGLLAVSTTSSDTIRTQLANDIVRIGDGRTDGLSEIAKEFLGRLEAAKFDPSGVCKRLRIYTVAALSADQAAVTAAKAELTHICANGADRENAWNALYADAARLIEQRGRRDISSVLRVLSAAGIAVATADQTAPAAVLNKLSQFNFESNATFSVLGVRKPLQTDRDWIGLTAVIRDPDETVPQTFADALQSYHSWESRVAHRDAETVDPETLARFIKRGILVAGPGMGKTTLLKRVARRYSEDKIPVLKVRLGSVAARMRNGSGFEEAVFQQGLDGSGLSAEEVRKCGFSNWLLLCDGLDECGSLQEAVAVGVTQFAIGYPECRIIVTTRPVGYRAVHFAEWRHYDLSALDTSAAHAHAARLVEAIADEGAAIQENAWDICRRELEDKSIADVIGRTPLLVGLAAAILSSGTTLAKSREALFEQIFGLIDSVADTRPHERPATALVLRRFVDILGWQLATNPLRNVEEVIRECGKILAIDMGVTPLQGAAYAESYAAYWEQVGLIEELGFEAKKAFAFIHKSFGEFAAARYLCALSDAAQTAFIGKNTGTEAWAEPLRFAASMGLSEKIAAYFLANQPKNEKGFQQLVELLRVVSEASTPPSKQLRAKIFALAVETITGSRAQKAYTIGKGLAATAKLFPDEVGPLSTPLLSSDSEWTSHTAWHCAVAAGPKHYSLDGLIGFIERYVADASPRAWKSRNGMLNLNTGSERDMTEEFALAACAEIMDRAAPEVADSLVPKMLNHHSFGSVGFTMKAQKLVLAKGKNYKIGSLDGWRSKNFGPSEEYRKAETVAIAKVLDLLGAEPESVEICDPSKPLLNLSAFLHASNWMKMPVSDFWHWSETYDHESTKIVIQTFVKVSGIDPIALKTEATLAKRHLGAQREDQGRWWSSGLFDVTTSVDPPTVDWSGAKLLSESKQQIGAALSHPSEWLVWMAANLLDNMLEPDEREPMIRKVFEAGNGYALWAASALASELPKDRAIRLIYDRLEKPLVWGCRHLFNLLARLSPPIDDRLIAALEAGIFAANDWTACAAAEMAKSLAGPQTSLLLPAIERGIAHWQVHEKPYPKEGGAIPNSPRDALVTAKAAIAPPSYAEIRSLMGDSRHDVRKVGENYLVPRLSAEADERRAFLNDIIRGELASYHLRDILKAKIPLNGSDLALISDALTSNEKQIKLSAITVLEEQYFDEETSRSLAAKLTNDPDQQVRERAHSVLDAMSPD
jgi:hypothetical protein